MCSRRSTCSTAASCRSVRVLSGEIDGRRHAACATTRRRRPLVRHARRCWRQRRQARRAPKLATSLRSASSTPSRPATRLPSGKAAPASLRCARSPLCAGAVDGASPAADRKDDVKLGQALLRADEEDPSLTRRPQSATRTRWCCGGRARCICASRMERLRGRFGINVKQHAPGGRLSRDHPQADHAARPAQEAVGRPWPVRRCGAGGQAAAAGRGLYSSTETSGRRCGAAQLYPGGGGRRRATACMHGPLGFPVVDVAVTLTDGSYHTRRLRPIMAFRTAARIGVSEGAASMPAGAAGADPCGRNRLPDRGDARRSMPFCRVGEGRSSASTPARAGSGWDVVRAHVARGEIGDLIVELHAPATAGAGSFTRSFDHMAEVNRPSGRSDRCRASGGGLVT